MNKIAKDIGDWRRHHGFFTPSDLKTEDRRDMMLGKLMLVCSEVGEAAEAVRHNDLANFKEEIADTIIRLLDISDAMEIDIEKEISEKMKKNWQRPIKHGKLCSL